MGASVAVVSGKGGSGKTVVAAEIASLMSRQSLNVILMDADTATGGLSYYLGLKYVRNITEGFTSYALAKNSGTPRAEQPNLMELIQVVSDDYSGTRFGFLAIGDHRRLSRVFDTPGRSTQSLGSLLKNAV